MNQEAAPPAHTVPTMNHSLGYTVLVAVVYVLAVMRLTRLVNFDTILKPLRVAVARPAAIAAVAAVEAENSGQAIISELHRLRAGRWNALLTFLSCPWCVGMWISIATVWLPLHHSDNPLVRYIGIALAVSMVIGLLAPLSADEENIVDDDEPQAVTP